MACLGHQPASSFNDVPPARSLAESAARQLSDTNPTNALNTRTRETMASLKADMSIERLRGWDASLLQAMIGPLHERDGCF